MFQIFRNCHNAIKVVALCVVQCPSFLRVILWLQYPMRVVSIIWWLLLYCNVTRQLFATVCGMTFPAVVADYVLLKGTMFAFSDQIVFSRKIWIELIFSNYSRIPTNWNSSNQKSQRSRRFWVEGYVLDLGFKLNLLFTIAQIFHMLRMFYLAWYFANLQPSEMVWQHQCGTCM